MVRGRINFRVGVRVRGKGEGKGKGYCLGWG